MVFLAFALVTRKGNCCDDGRAHAFNIQGAVKQRFFLAQEMPVQLPPQSYSALRLPRSSH